ncbi:MAG: glycosyltransferase [Cyanobacteria bacterium P01_G01_bin.38]
MTKHYLFYVRDVLPQPKAHLIQVVQCANAAANLGYPTVLSFTKQGYQALNPIDWVYPFRPQPIWDKFQQFYNTGNRLKLLPLSMPWPIGAFKGKLTSPSTLACKYYWPVHLKKRIQLVHTRDWNFAKTVISSGVPVIYECHHYQKAQYEADIVNSPWLQVAVTVIETVRDNMIANGMPAHKILVAPNGYNKLFLERHPDAAQHWRTKLLGDRFEQLVVYAGALYAFKGIDQIIAIAHDFPTVKFAIAGGPASQQTIYESTLKSKQIENIELVGFLPQHDLSSLLQAANALVHPHCNGQAATFTSPLKLFDYLASGTPVVATTIPSLKNLTTAKTGIVWCAPDDTSEFRKSLKHLLDSQLGTQGYCTDSIAFVQRFTWENRIQAILDRVAPEIRPQKFA